MQRTFIRAAVLLALVALSASSVSGLTPPQATSTVRARVTSAIDDEIEGVSYLRVRLTVVAVTEASGGAPGLGAGETVSAIVRDPADRAILRSASPTLELTVQLASFGQSVYEVQTVVGRPAVSSANQTELQSTGRTVLLLGLLVILSAGALAGLTRYHRSNHGRPRSV